MRHGRAKAARKTLQYFGRTIGLQAPYWILLDATMVVAMFQQKILPFKERMDRVLQTTGSDGPNKYCIAKAAVEELEMIYNGLKTKNHFKAETFEQALEFIRNECIVLIHRKEEERIKESEKDKNEESAEKEQLKTSVQDDLLQHMQEYDTPYIVATQDEELLDTLRSMGTHPIVRLANVSVLILEHPSKQSQLQFKGVERKKWRHSLQESEKELVNLAKRQTRQAAKQNVQSILPPQKRAKTKAKGPNPLSCKRKQGNEGKAGKESASKKRRLRSKKQKDS
jgi:rRNA-processing protein FCF1